MSFQALLNIEASDCRIYEALISSLLLLVTYNMDNYPSKRRKTSPFTSIPVKSSVIPKGAASQEDYELRLNGKPSTQADQTYFTPHEVHPAIPLTNGSQELQSRPVSLCESATLQESTNIISCRKESLSNHELRTEMQPRF